MHAQEDGKVVSSEEEGEHEEERLEARANLRPVLEETEGQNARLSGKLPFEDDEDNDEACERDERADNNGVAPGTVALKSVRIDRRAE